MPGKLLHQYYHRFACRGSAAGLMPAAPVGVGADYPERYGRRFPGERQRRGDSRAAPPWQVNAHNRAPNSNRQP